MRAFGRSRRSWKTPSGLRLAARPPLSSSWREHLRWRHRHTGSRAVSAKGHHSSPPHHHHACARCRVQRTNLDMLHRVRRSVAIHTGGVRSQQGVCWTVVVGQRTQGARTGAALTRQRRSTMLDRVGPAPPSPAAPAPQPPPNAQERRVKSWSGLETQHNADTRSDTFRTLLTPAALPAHTTVNRAQQSACTDSPGTDVARLYSCTQGCQGSLYLIRPVPRKASGRARRPARTFGSCWSRWGARRGVTN